MPTAYFPEDVIGLFGCTFVLSSINADDMVNSISESASKACGGIMVPPACFNRSFILAKHNLFCLSWSFSVCYISVCRFSLDTHTTSIALLMLASCIQGRKLLNSFRLIEYPLADHCRPNLERRIFSLATTFVTFPFI